jgi:hypothetical protein
MWSISFEVLVAFRWWPSLAETSKGLILLLKTLCHLMEFNPNFYLYATECNGQRQCLSSRYLKYILKFNKCKNLYGRWILSRPSKWGWVAVLPMNLLLWPWLGSAVAMATAARNTSASVVLMVVTAVHKLTPPTAAYIQGVLDDPLTRVAIRTRSLPLRDRARCNLWNIAVVAPSGIFFPSNIEFKISQYLPVLIIIQRNRTSVSNTGGPGFRYQPY